MQTLLTYFRIFLASWIGEVLNWAGVVLATVNVHLAYDKSAPGAIAQIIIGVVLSGAHVIAQHFTPTPLVSKTPLTVSPGVKALLFFAALSPFLLTGCAGTTISSVETTAEKLIGSATGYAETLGNMLTTGSATLVSTADAFEALATQWGLLPANSDQLATYNKVKTIIATVGADSAAATSVIQSLQANGTIPSISTSGASTTVIWHTHEGYRIFTRNSDSGHISDYVISEVAVARDNNGLLVYSF